MNSGSMRVLRPSTASFAVRANVAGPFERRADGQRHARAGLGRHTEREARHEGVEAIELAACVRVCGDGPLDDVDARVRGVRERDLRDAPSEGSADVHARVDVVRGADHQEELQELLLHQLIARRRRDLLHRSVAVRIEGARRDAAELHVPRRDRRHVEAEPDREVITDAHGARELGEDGDAHVGAHGRLRRASDRDGAALVDVHALVAALGHVQVERARERDRVARTREARGVVEEAHRRVAACELGAGAAVRTRTRGRELETTGLCEARGEASDAEHRHEEDRTAGPCSVRHRATS